MIFTTINLMLVHVYSSEYELQALLSLIYNANNYICHKRI